MVKGSIITHCLNAHKSCLQMLQEYMMFSVAKDEHDFDYEMEDIVVQLGVVTHD